MNSSEEDHFDSQPAGQPKSKDNSEIKPDNEKSGVETASQRILKREHPGVKIEVAGTTRTVIKIGEDQKKAGDEQKDSEQNKDEKKDNRSGAQSAEQGASKDDSEKKPDKEKKAGEAGQQDASLQDNSKVRVKVSGAPRVAIEIGAEQNKEADVKKESEENKGDQKGDQSSSKPAEETDSKSKEDSEKTRNKEKNKEDHGQQRAAPREHSQVNVEVVDAPQVVIEIGGEQKKADGAKKDSEQNQDGKDDKQKPKSPPLYKKPVFIITVSIVGIVLIVGVILLWLILRQYVSTDDAYIDGHVTQVSPQISALVLNLHIDDNQLVHKGDLLLELDPTDYNVALEQAKAQVMSAEGRLAQAEAQIGTAHASVTQAEAQVEAAQVQYDNATRDLKRYQDVDARARSKQQLDNSDTTQKNAHAQLEEAKAQKTSAEANVVSAEASVKAAEGELQTSQASEKRAEVNLSYCKIYAPTDGRVTLRTVETGNYVAPGEALFMLVDPNVWVTANFKETQLTHMRPGQPVTIKVDAFPGVKWQGHVDSIQAGSGSRFSILPAENATGNYVKVVQRVPVKIIFDHNANTNDAPMLSPGLSVIPSVKVR